MLIKAKFNLVDEFLKDREHYGSGILGLEPTRFDQDEIRNAYKQESNKEILKLFYDKVICQNATLKKRYQTFLRTSNLGSIYDYN